MIFLAPHNDDEALFGAYTLMRHKPLVILCTDGYIQGERGDPVTAEQRINETLEAMKILGCEVKFLGIKDTELTEETLLEALKPYHLNMFTVFAPAIEENGNAQHNIVGKVADKIFAHVVHYMTYTKTDLWRKGTKEIIPTQEEIDLKNKALDCYKSQIKLASTAPHFAAVRGRSEWYE